ncbi:MAG: alpha/beta fold hydrolase [bacterium]
MLAVLVLLGGCASAPEEDLDRATIEELALLKTHASYENGRLVVVDGIVLHFRTWLPSSGSGPPAMLIHGLGASTFSFREISPWMAESGYVVVAVDVPPFGYSDRRDRAMDAVRHDLLWGLADTLEEDPSLLGARVTGPWTLVGHSLGGRVAAGMARSRPDQVADLVLLAGAVQFEQNRASLPFVTTDPVSRLLEASLRELGSPDSVASVLATAYGETPSGEAIQGYYEPFTVPGTVPAVVHFSSQALQEIGPLREISARTLLIWGNEDTWVPIAVGYRAAARIPDSLMIVVPGAAHIPMETHPHHVRRAMRLFFEEEG